MILSRSESGLFFKLMLPLQFFVNEKLNVLPRVKTFEKYCKASMQEKFEVRQRLFENIYLMDEFIDENPQDYPMKELAAVSKWKKFVKGDFFIERYLKDYAAFVSDEAEVFAVYGLTAALDEYFPKFALPLRLGEVIFLPFQDKIITDGFFLPYNIIFGGGIKKELKEIYMKAKRKDKIIKTI